MTPITTKKQATIVALRNLGIALIFIIASAAFNYYAGHKITAIGKVLSQKKQVLSSLQQRTLKIQNASDDADYVGGNDKALENALVSEEDISPYLNYARTVARQYNLSQTVHFSGPQPYMAQAGLAVDQSQYSNELISSLDQVIKYLQAMEHAPYIQRVDSINVTAPADGGWKNSGAVFDLVSQLFVKQ